MDEEYARKGVSENVNGGANARVGECPPDGKEFASRDSAGVFEILASVRGIAWGIDAAAHARHVVVIFENGCVCVYE